MKNCEAACYILDMYYGYIKANGVNHAMREAATKAIAELMTFPTVDTFIEEKYPEVNGQIKSGYNPTIPFEDKFNIDAASPAKEMTEEEFDVYRQTGIAVPGEIVIVKGVRRNK